MSFIVFVVMYVVKMNTEVCMDGLVDELRGLLFHSFPKLNVPILPIADSSIKTSSAPVPSVVKLSGYD